MPRSAAILTLILLCAALVMLLCAADRGHTCVVAVKAAKAMVQAEDLLFAGMNGCRDGKECLSQEDAHGLIGVYDVARGDFEKFGRQCLGE